MSEKRKYIIHDDVLYEEQGTSLVTTYKAYAIEQREPTPKWKGPKLPWNLWQEMLAWCQVTQEKFGSEALVMLFFDVEKNEWSHWYPPQITNGLAVEADDTADEYKEQRKAYPDLQFGTLHHHCTAGAFASGTDQKDEEDREGLHFTIGNLDKDQFSVHFRICIQGTCYVGNAIDVIEPPEDVSRLPEKYQRAIMKDMIVDPVNAEQWDFTEPLKNVKKRTYTRPTYNRQQNFSGIGFGSKATTSKTTTKYIQSVPSTIKQWERLIEEEWDLVDEVLEGLEEALFNNSFVDSFKPDRTPAAETLRFLTRKYKSKNKITEQECLLKEVIELIYDKHNFFTPKSDKEAAKFTTLYLHQIHELYENHYVI